MKKTLLKFTETKCENRLSEIVLENECSLFDMINFESNGDQGSFKTPTEKGSILRMLNPKIF